MRYRKLIIMICQFVLFMGFIFSTHMIQPKRTVPTFSYKADTKEEITEELVIALLMNDIRSATDTYYKEYFTTTPVIYNYEVKIQDISKKDGTIYVTFGILCVLGPHDSVGYEEALFKVNASGQISLDYLKHLKTYDLPERYNDLIIKPLPKTENKNNNKNNRNHLEQKNSKNTGDSSDVVLTSSMQQMDWSKLSSEEKEAYLERLVMLIYVPQIDEAVKSYYNERRGFDIMRITDLKAISPYEYEMKLEISTFVGPHNPPYGLDTITIRFNRLCEGKIINYEHKDDN